MIFYFILENITYTERLEICDMNNPSIFIGPMSKNVVDAVIGYANTTNTAIGLIPSRRQIEYNGGYSNNWTTNKFAKYVKDKTQLVSLQRDHGGRMQNTTSNSLSSYKADALNGFDLIHIDPWKYFVDLDEVILETVNNILFCNHYNSNCQYEIGTEEAIHRYTCEELDYFLSNVKKLLDKKWKKVKYAVIQSGTALSATKNIGVFDSERCKNMVKVCENYGLLSKEHNGDYLTFKNIKKRFDIGLSAINIAPQFGVSETKQIMSVVEANEEAFKDVFNLCYNSKKWVKWLPEGYEVTNQADMKKIIEVSCHYVFSNSKFTNILNDLKIQKKDLVANHTNYLTTLYKEIR